MTDEDDTTIWERVRRPRRTNGYADGERGATVPAPASLMPYLPLALAVLAGMAGYVRMESAVEVLQRDQIRTEEAHAKDMADYSDWNKSISERVRELERGR